MIARIVGSHLVFILLFLPGLTESFGVAQSPPPRAQRQSSPNPERRTQVLPLDPLSSNDRAFAQKIALEDPRVRDLLGGSPHLVSIALLFLKPDKDETALAKPVEIDRHAEVLFRREDEAGVRAVVNLSKRSVVSAERTTSMELPLTLEDISEAAKAALANEELRGALGEELKNYTAAAQAPNLRSRQFAITGLRLFSKVEEDPCTKHRCVQLMFRRGRDYLAETSVWVDLTERHVYVERRNHESH